MLDWSVSYYLGNTFHQYVVEAKNYYDAHQKVLNKIPASSQDAFRHLRVERYYMIWN